MAKIKTVKSVELHSSKMVMGNENKYSRVIHNGRVKEWTGIGWLDLRHANKKDTEKFPTVIPTNDKGVAV